LQLFRSGDLQKRVKLARKHLTKCDLCARYCQVDRTRGIDGTFCRTGSHARLVSVTGQQQPEMPLRGTNGSGQIRFAGCNLRCQYCQGGTVNRATDGVAVDAEDLAATMLSKQAQGNHNINLVAPSHVITQVLEALVIACERGLNLPLVYSSSGYDSLEALQLLDGVIDIYAVEIKYGDNAGAQKYSQAPNYVEYSHIALREMHRQVGDLIVDEDGIARRGLLVRHMILPANQASTKKVLSYISAEISPDTYVNLMDCYQPRYDSGKYEKLNRPINETEVRQALRCGDRCGLHRIDLQTSRPWSSL